MSFSVETQLPSVNFCPMTPRISSCQFPSFRHLLLHAMIALLLVLVSVANASSAPTVTLTKPVEGTVMPMAGNLLSIKVSGTAVPSGTTKIAKVEVLDGAKVIASTATGTLTDLATLGLTMGAHTIQLKATDSVGGISYSTPVNITLTGTPPTSVITVPEMGGTYGTKTGTSTIAVTGNAVGTTGASIAKIEVYEGATLLGQPAVANPASLNLTFALGAHTIEWRVTDGRGVTSSSFTSFTVVPAVPPTVVVTSPANGAEVPMTGNLFSIKVSGSATLYDHTRLVRLDVMDGDASIYGTTVASTLDNVPTLGLKKGPHAIWLKATDNLGQVTASAINNITLTGTPPATTLTSPEQGGRYGTVGAKGNVTFSGTVAGTSGATITKIEVWEGGTLVGGVPIATSTSATFAFTLGAHTAEWRVTDGRGTTTSQFVDFTVVPAVPPTVVITAPAAGDMPMTGNLFSIKASGSATAADHAKITRIDVMDGTTSIYNTTVSTTLVDVPTLGLKSGPHSISLKATDSVGAIGYSDTVNIVLAGPPPATTLTAPEQGGRYGTITSAATITFSGTVAGTAGASISKIELWEGTKLIGTVPVASSTSAAYAFAMGAHTVEWRVTDGRDKSTSLFVDFTVVPSIAPLVTISAPAEGAAIPMYHDTQSINVSGYTTFSDHAKLAKFEVMDGTTSIYATTVSSTLNAVPTLGIKPGPHTIQLRVTDSTGMVGYSEPVHITLTSTPPTAVVTAPVNGATIPTGTSTATVPVTGTAVPNDGATITRIELFENGTLLGASPLSNPATISKAYGLGPHTVEWRVTDSRGMVTRSYTSFVVIAGQAPTVSMSAPADGASYAITVGTSFAVPISASAAAAAPATISKMEVLDGSTVKYTLNNSTVMNTTVALGAGKHALQIRVTDSVGKTALSNIANVMLTVAPPTVVMTAPVNASNYVAPASNVVTVAVKGSATPANGATIVSIDLMEDDKVLQSVSGGTFNANQSFAADGGILGHNIWLRATDSTGQQAASAVSTVIVYSYFPDDAATFIDQTVPTSMRTGQPYNATVRMLNTGGTTWTEAATYRLLSGSPRDNRVWVSTGRGYLAGPVAPGQIATFNIPITAPQKPGVYSFEWRMVRDSVGGWFGNATEPVAIAVADGAGPSAGLTITPSNARMVGNTPVTLTVSANAIETGRKVTKLDVLVDTGHGYSTVPAKSATGTADRLKLDFTTTATAGVYKYKARSTDDLGIQTDSDNLIVNVADSTVLGAVSGVRIDADSKPFLVGWFCQPGAAKQLRYEVLVDAPTVDAGGTPLLTGVANVSGELDDAAVQSSCGTPGVSHNFKVDLSATTEASASVTENTSPAPRLMAMRMASAPVAAAAPVSTTYTNAYAGRALYVHALDVGAAPVVLPCADNSCTMPGSTRIALTSPTSGAAMMGPDALFARTVVSGTSDPLDEVAIGIDGTWIAAQADTGGNAYYVNFPDVQPRATPYTIQARVRQGSTTLYSVQNQIKVIARPLTTLALTSPVAGAAVSVGAPVALVATAAGETSGVAGVKFYANGNLIGAGVKTDGNWLAQWIAAVEGTYSLQAAAYDADGRQLALSALASISAKAAADNGKLVPVAIDPPHLANGDAGSLPGALSVGDDGTAKYYIPLVVPPGTAGLEPELSLSYSSNGPNGMVGLGWSLGGLSSIHRCAKTVAQDQIGGRIGFDSGDRLCLDGSRLLRVNGANPGTDVSAIDAAYWAADAEYRTEKEAFSRIRRLSNGGFKVESKDGGIRYYGTDVNSAIAAQGRTDGQPLLWALARTEDRSGNYLLVDYLQDVNTGEYLPRQIRYGGNSTANQDPDLVVRFGYEGRTDAQLLYIGGSRNDVRNRLTHVQTYIGAAADGSGGTLVRDHTIHYTESAATGRSVVDWMQACAPNPNSGLADCLPATTFEWGAGAGPTLTTLPIAPFAWPVPEVPGGYPGLNGQPLLASLMPLKYQGNLDGSGRTSFFTNRAQGVVPCCAVAANALRIRLPDGREFSHTLNTAAAGFGDTNVNLRELLVGDLDGDGRDDLVMIAPTPDGFAFRWGYCMNEPLPDGTVNFDCHPGPTAGGGVLLDVRNDRRMHFVSSFDSAGKADDCFIEGGVMQCATLYRVGSGPLFSGQDNINLSSNIVSVDLSAHSASDLLTSWRLFVPAADAAHSYSWSGPRDLSIGFATCFNQQNRFVCSTTYQKTVPGDQVQLVSGTLTPQGSNVPVLTAGQSIGDMNGDGLTDFVYNVRIPAFSSGESYVCLSKESGMDCQAIAALDVIGNSFFPAAGLVGDFMGDGINRIIATPAPGAAKSLCRYSGVGLICQALPTTNGGLPAAVYMDDSGVPAFLTGHYNPNPSATDNRVTDTFTAVTFAGPPAADKLIGVTNGLGRRDQVDYARGSDAAVYQRVARVGEVNVRPVYPQVAVAPGIMVKQVRRSNGQGGWLHTDYYYEGALAHTQGRGSLGFAKVQSTDVENGIQTVSVFSQNYPYSGMLLRSQKIARNGVILTDAINTPDSVVFTHASGAQTVFPYIRHSAGNRKDLDGSDMGSVVTDNQYMDGWGNVTQQDVSVSGAGETYSSRVITSYRNDANAWLLGLPESVATTKTAPGSADVTRTVSYDYDTATGLLRSETIEPLDPVYRSAIKYDRSANPFGLINVKIQAWHDPDPLGDGDFSRVLQRTEYDSKGRFAHLVINAANHLEVYDYDAGTGARRSLLDRNGLTTVWDNDGFGLVQVERRPDGSQIRQYRKQCLTDCPAWAVMATIQDVFHQNLPGAVPVTEGRVSVPKVTYSDSLGHVVRDLTYGMDGRAIAIDRQYDEQGRLYQTDRPRFISDAAYPASRQHYDDLGRLADYSAWDERTEYVNTITYQGFVTTSQNAKKQVRTDARDALGRLRKVIDAKGGVTLLAYEPFGNLRSTTDPNNYVVKVDFDRLGRKIALGDPDLGLIEYGVDPVGHVWKQTSPKQRSKGEFTRTRYDALDRMVARYESDLESHWEFDTAEHGKGQLAEAYTYLSGSAQKDYRRVHSYDALGRPMLTKRIMMPDYSELTEYDGWGRLSQQTYHRGLDPAKLFVSRYNQFGYLSQIDRDQLTLWKIDSQDAEQRLTQVSLGNALVQTKGYHEFTGRQTSGHLAAADGAMRVVEGYEYDAIGNVSKRNQYWNTAGFGEDFDYDELNRIKYSSTGGRDQNYTYDAAGNVTSKTGVAEYVYPSAGSGLYVPKLPGAVPAHAIKSLGGVAFQYDDNGNLISGVGHVADWSSFDMPNWLEKGGVRSTFVYGPEHQRVRQVRTGDTTVEYLGGQEVETAGGQVVLIRTYWPRGIGMEIDRPGRATELYWTYTDRLGSPIAITDQSGALVEKLAYDVWGQRRSIEGGLGGVLDNKGYTGHEMLDKLNLVHMNGRVFDPLTARFLSADPFVQAPDNGQSYNRYSYVLNNPTNLTDPSGFQWGDLRTTSPADQDDPCAHSTCDFVKFPMHHSNLNGQNTAAGRGASNRGNSNQSADATPDKYVQGSVLVGQSSANPEVQVIVDAKTLNPENKVERKYGTTDQVMGQWMDFDLINQLGKSAGASDRQLFWLGMVSMIGNPKQLVEKGAKKITQKILRRKSLGKDGAESIQIIEKLDEEMISRTHKVTKDGNILHQHQNHTGKYGGERQFPDEWTGTKTTNAPYENVPPSFPPEPIPPGGTRY